MTKSVTNTFVTVGFYSNQCCSMSMRLLQTPYFPHIKISPSLTILLILTYNFAIEMSYALSALEKKTMFITDGIEGTYSNFNILFLGN